MRTFVFAALAIIPVAPALVAQDADPGKVVFENRCARCHGSDGNGGERGPAIRTRLAARDNSQLTSLIRGGLPSHTQQSRPNFWNQAGSAHEGRWNEVS